MRGDELFVMSLLTKMEVRSNRVFEEVNDEITAENQKCRASSPQSQTFRDDFDDRSGQHESCAQGHEVLQIRPLPLFTDNNRSAEHVGGRGGQAKQEAEHKWVHWESRMIAEGGRLAVSHESSSSARSTQKISAKCHSEPL